MSGGSASEVLLIYFSGSWEPYRQGSLTSASFQMCCFFFFLHLTAGDKQDEAFSSCVVKSIFAFVRH